LFAFVVVVVVVVVVAVVVVVVVVVVVTCLCSEGIHLSLCLLLFAEHCQSCLLIICIWGLETKTFFISLLIHVHFQLFPD
jgi:hypothetical protein